MDTARPAVKKNIVGLALRRSAGARLGWRRVRRFPGLDHLANAVLGTCWTAIRAPSGAASVSRRSSRTRSSSTSCCAGTIHRQGGDRRRWRRRSTHGVGRDLRPRRRRFPSVLGGSGVAGAPLREDALRPGAPGAHLHPCRGRRWASRVGARSSRRRSATCCATCAIPTAASLGPGRRLPRARRPRPRGPVPHLDPGRGLEVLGDDAPAALEWYEIGNGGNFEAAIPVRLNAGRWARPAEIEGARRRLFDARSRAPPGLDDKVLAEWNAMMFCWLAEAGPPRRRDDLGRRRRGQRRVPAPASYATTDRRWKRAWHADAIPRARHDGLAANHATLVDAFTRLGEATGEARWMDGERSPTPCSTASGTPTGEACTPPRMTARR